MARSEERGATELEDAFARHRDGVGEGVTDARRDDVLGREVAARSLTLVRDEARNLPFRFGPERRILAVMPRPVDLTPADRSAQADLVDSLLATDRPVVNAALRTPWDLLVYQDAPTHLCTYSVVPVLLEALATALVGHFEPSGNLPVPLGDLSPVGHGL